MPRGFSVGRARRAVAAGSAVLGSLLLSVPAAPLVLATTGCAGDDCDSDTQTWGSCTQGDAIDSTHWESGPVLSTFLDFHGERTWILDPTPWMGSRTPTGFEADIAFNPLPNADAGLGFAPSAGNLSEITLLPSANGWKVQVLNDTCARYYLRVVLTYAPLGPGESLPSACQQGDAGH